ncbi:MAG: nucleoside triphosphate pyrophosphohydrolase [Chloroflexota bacterium]
MDLTLVAFAFEVLRIEPRSKLVLLEAPALLPAHVLPTPPDADMLLTGVHSRELASHLRAALLSVYPATHVVRFVRGSEVYESTIQALDSLLVYSATTCLYVPSLGEGTAFESFQEIVAHLRAPDGCPWDREQTHASLRAHLLEEAYEALEALDQGDARKMAEEFGDLLLQIVLHAQIASEAGNFGMTDIIKGIYDKIVRRHPHVFGDVDVDGVDGVLANWERLKEKERGKKKDGKGLLDGVPLALPALIQAQEYQDRAARVGFDWPEIEGVLAKIVEEIEEVRQAADQEQLASEIGDLLFALVNLARWKKVDAESALRGTNMRFKRRFGYVERGAKTQARALADLSLEEMDALWNEAKNQEG